MTTAAHRQTAPPSEPLDAATLGRPVHLLERFNALWRSDLETWLRERLNQRYRARYEIGAISMRRLDAATHDAAWLGFAGARAPIFCSMDRKLVLSLLAHRYGMQGQAAPDDGAKETASEERLAQQFGQAWALLLSRRIEAGLGAAVDGAEGDCTSFGRATPPAGGWLLDTSLLEPGLSGPGHLRFALHDAWIERLWQRLAPARSRPAPDVAGPLSSRLNLRLIARLLQKDMPLGELAELKVGDVIPINLGSADVLVEDSRLFTAAVAEHQGRLCLTSFTDAE